MARWLVQTVIVLSAFRSVIGSERIDENVIEMADVSAFPSASADFDSVTVINPMRGVEATPVYPAFPVMQAQVISSYRITQINGEPINTDAENQIPDARDLKEMCCYAGGTVCSTACTVLGTVLVIAATCGVGIFYYMTDFTDHTIYDDAHLDYLESIAIEADLRAEGAAVNLDLPPIEEAIISVS